MNVKRHIFEFIVDHHTRWNYLPSRAEVRSFFSARVDDVDLHLEQLEREGLLKLGEDGQSITLAPLGAATRSITLQNVSTQRAAGGELPAADTTITVDLLAAGIRLDGDLFARVVVDDSMLDAGVRAGDVAIFRMAQPTRGDIVAVEVSGQLLLRRYLVVNGIPHLLAESAAHADLAPAFDVPVQGVLCCVISPRTGATGSLRPPTDPVKYVQEKTGSYTVAQPQRSRQEASPEAGGNWPVPPTGITLNEKGSAAYAAHKRPHR